MPDDEQDESEPGDAGDHEGVPADLVEVHEVQEWQRTVESGEGHPR